MQDAGCGMWEVGVRRGDEGGVGVPFIINQGHSAIRRSDPQ